MTELTFAIIGAAIIVLSFAVIRQSRTTYRMAQAFNNFVLDHTHRVEDDFPPWSDHPQNPLAKRLEEVINAKTQEEWEQGNNVSGVDIYVTPFSEVSVRWHVVTSDGEELTTPVSKIDHGGTAEA